jgi:hypothetical protein
MRNLLLLLACFSFFNSQSQNPKEALIYQNQVIGTVISSVLNYQQLCSQIGENPNTPSTNTYVPCDGRVIYPSPLSLLFPDQSMNQAPDLRGKFIRGLNNSQVAGSPGMDIELTGDPDGESRLVGSYQADQNKQHSHTVSKFENSIIKDMSNDKDQRKCSLGDTQIVQSDESGGKEARPRNIALYFYIKVR